MEANLLDIVKALKNLLEPLLAMTLEDLEKCRNIESAVKALANKALGRKDLRIRAEMLFNDLISEFRGFDLFDPSNRQYILESGLRKLRKLEYLLDMGKALSEIRPELSPPPKNLAELVEEEKRKQSIEENALKREILRRNDQHYKSSRANHRTAAQSPTQAKGSSERKQHGFNRHRRRHKNANPASTNNTKFSPPKAAPTTAQVEKPSAQASDQKPQTKKDWRFKRYKRK